jgi:hypothetical protein
MVSSNYLGEVAAMKTRLRPLPAPKATITLGDMADKGMRMLAVACRRCDRRGGSASSG